MLHTCRKADLWLPVLPTGEHVAVLLLSPTVTLDLQRKEGQYLLQVL